MPNSSHQPFTVLSCKWVSVLGTGIRNFSIHHLFRHTLFLLLYQVSYGYSLSPLPFVNTLAANQSLWRKDVLLLPVHCKMKVTEVNKTKGPSNQISLRNLKLSKVKHLYHLKASVKCLLFQKKKKKVVFLSKQQKRRL